MVRQLENSTQKRIKERMNSCFPMRTTCLSFVPSRRETLVPETHRIADWYPVPCCERRPTGHQEHQRNQTPPCLVTAPLASPRDPSETASRRVLPPPPVPGTGAALTAAGKVVCLQRRRRRRRDADARVVAAARRRVEEGLRAASGEGAQAPRRRRPGREECVEGRVLHVLSEGRAQKGNGLFAAASPPNQMPEEGKCGVTLRR